MSKRVLTPMSGASVAIVLFCFTITLARFFDQDPSGRVRYVADGGVIRNIQSLIWTGRNIFLYSQQIII